MTVSIVLKETLMKRIRELEEESKANYDAAASWKEAALKIQESDIDNEYRAIVYKRALEKILKDDIYQGPDGEDIHGENGMIAYLALEEVKEIEVIE